LFSSTHILAGLLPKRAHILARLLLKRASLTRVRNHLFSSSHILACLLLKRAHILAHLLLKRALHREKTFQGEHGCFLRRVNDILKLSMRLRPILTPQRPILRYRRAPLEQFTVCPFRRAGSMGFSGPTPVIRPKRQFLLRPH
jgi:hypothetical protein